MDTSGFEWERRNKFVSEVQCISNVRDESGQEAIEHHGAGIREACRTQRFKCHGRHTNFQVHFQCSHIAS